MKTELVLDIGTLMFVETFFVLRNILQNSVFRFVVVVANSNYLFISGST